MQEGIEDVGVDQINEERIGNISCLSAMNSPKQLPINFRYGQLM